MESEDSMEELKLNQRKINHQNRMNYIYKEGDSTPESNKKLSPTASRVMNL